MDEKKKKEFKLQYIFLCCALCTIFFLCFYDLFGAIAMGGLLAISVLLLFWR